MLVATCLRAHGPAKSPEQFLVEAGVSLDNPSLIRALNDTRPGVLSSAATVLAQNHVLEAGPLIVAKMRTEQNKQLILTLAQSLNFLGVQEGTKRLEQFCLSNNTERAEQMRAANALALTKNYSCLPSISKYLISGRDDEKLSALLYLSHIPTPQPNEPDFLGQRLLDIASNDPNEEVRSLARRVIAQIGDEATKKHLADQ
jgi:HEAT repeat protein